MDAQQQHEQALAALQAQLTEREAAAEKALLEASASRSDALRVAKEQHAEAVQLLQSRLGAQAAAAEAARVEASRASAAALSEAQARHTAATRSPKPEARSPKP